MGGNVEAYHDHLAEVEYERNRRLDILKSFGLSTVGEKGILALTHEKKKGFREFLFGTNGRELMSATHNIRLDDVVSLLRALGHTVRVVKADE